MFSNGRKTIGVFAENTSSEFQQRLCEGIVDAAKKAGYNVALFSCFGSYGQTDAYAEGDLRLYHLPNYNDFEGVILVLDTMDNLDNRQRVVRYIKAKCTCPIVSIRMTIPDVDCILVDNATCMDSIIRHFIVDHHFQRICFMTGPEHHFDAVERLNGFRRIMAEYNRSVDPHQIFYGDFWRNSGQAACDWFLEGEERPDAIICANDYMAMSVVNELIKRGIRVPDDISVAGYDGLDSGITFSPSITTAEAPFAQMGQRAVEQIIAQSAQIDPKPQNIYLKSELQRRESCGCINNYDSKLLSMRREYYEELSMSSHRHMLFSFMSIRLGEVTDIDGVGQVLSQYLGFCDHLKTHAICLNQNMSVDTKSTDYTPVMEVRTLHRDGKCRGPIRLSYDTRQLLPSELIDDSPQVWFFTPLHYLDYCLGYEAWQFEEDHPVGQVNFQFNVIVSNKIYETLFYQKMQQMIRHLEYSSMRDALTGLYNRGGFDRYGNAVFDHCKETQKPVFVAVMDLDSLKLINDSFGHVEGDFAIQRVATAISKCCGDQFTFARTGGDEFFLIAEDITEEEGLQCLERIRMDLDHFNSLRTKMYNIHASSGHYFDTPTSEEAMNDFIKVADRFMYHNKIEGKRRRNEGLR